jgi:cadmium resistance protein CadD (predicted permease)
VALDLDARPGPRKGFTSQALSVAGVTLANGGDNFGIYIPLFATAPAAIPIYIAVFAVMTAVWCALGYLVVNNPLIGSQVRRYGHVLLPIVLIALGLYILSGAMALMR